MDTFSYKHSIFIHYLLFIQLLAISCSLPHYKKQNNAIQEVLKDDIDTFKYCLILPSNACSDCIKQVSNFTVHNHSKKTAVIATNIIGDKHAALILGELFKAPRCYIDHDKGIQNAFSTNHNIQIVQLDNGNIVSVESVTAKELEGKLVAISRE